MDGMDALFSPSGQSVLLLAGLCAAGKFAVLWWAGRDHIWEEQAVPQVSPELHPQSPAPHQERQQAAPGVSNSPGLSGSMVWVFPPPPVRVQPPQTLAQALCCVQGPKSEQMFGATTPGCSQLQYPLASGIFWNLSCCVLAEAVWMTWD